MIINNEENENYLYLNFTFQRETQLTFLEKVQALCIDQSNTILTNYNIIVLLLQVREWHKVGNNKEQEV